MGGRKGPVLPGAEHQIALDGTEFRLGQLVGRKDGEQRTEGSRFHRQRLIGGPALGEGPERLDAAERRSGADQFSVLLGVGDSQVVTTELELSGASVGGRAQKCDVKVGAAGIAAPP